MIINITMPSSYSKHMLIRKTQGFLQRKSKIFSNSVFYDKCSDTIIHIHRNGLTLNFSPENKKSIDWATNYLDNIFKNTYIGVDKENPATKSLMQSKVYYLSKEGIYEPKN